MENYISRRNDWSESNKWVGVGEYREVQDFEADSKLYDEEAYSLTFVKVYDKYKFGEHELTTQQIKVEIGQAMAFIVLAFSELVHIFNIRNSKKSIFKTGIGGNKLLFLAIAIDASLMLVVLLVPALRNVFGIPVLPSTKIVESALLIFAPIVVVEIMKLLSLNGTNDK